MHKKKLTFSQWMIIYLKVSGIKSHINVHSTWQWYGFWRKYVRLDPTLI
jgi:hypothetical protein